MIFRQIQKLFLSLFLITSFGAYSFWRANADVALPSLPGNKPLATDTAVSETVAPSSSAPISTSVPTSLDNTIRRYFEDDGEEDDGVSVSARKPAPTQTPTLAPIQTNTPTPKPSASGTYKDGSYVGSASYAYTGTIQVTTIIRSGKIAEVQVTDASASRTSKQINADAIPTLKTETIQAQSANVNAVSGATYTTAAYIESLTAALAKARS